MEIAHVVVSDGLLEIDLERTARRSNSSFEPTTIVLYGRHFCGIAASDIEDCGSIRPGSEETYDFPVGMGRGGSPWAAGSCPWATGGCSGATGIGLRRCDDFGTVGYSCTGTANGNNEVFRDRFCASKRRYRANGVPGGTGAVRVEGQFGVLVCFHRCGNIERTVPVASE